MVAPYRERKDPCFELDWRPGDVERGLDALIAFAQKHDVPFDDKTWLLLRGSADAFAGTADRPEIHGDVAWWFTHRVMLGPALASVFASLLAVGTMVVALVTVEAYLALGLCIALFGAFMLASRNADEARARHVTVLSFAPFVVAIGAVGWIRRYDLAALLAAASCVAVLANLWLRKAAVRAREAAASAELP